MNLDTACNHMIQEGERVAVVIVGSLVSDECVAKLIRSIEAKGLSVNLVRDQCIDARHAAVMPRSELQGPRARWGGVK